MSKPGAADVRSIRPFSLTDAQLIGYIGLAEDLLPSAEVITNAAERETLWALLAAHLATALAEPEPSFVTVGPVKTAWPSNSDGAKRAAVDGELETTAPGRIYRRRLRKWTTSRVLR